MPLYPEEQFLRLPTEILQAREILQESPKLISASEKTKNWKKVIQIKKVSSNNKIVGIEFKQPLTFKESGQRAAMPFLRKRVLGKKFPLIDKIYVSVAQPQKLVYFLNS